MNNENKIFECSKCKKEYKDKLSAEKCYMSDVKREKQSMANKSSKSESMERAELEALKKKTSAPTYVSFGSSNYSAGFDWEKIIKYVVLFGIVGAVIYYFGRQGVIFAGAILILGLFLLMENVRNFVAGLFTALHLGGVFENLIKILLIPLLAIILLGGFWGLVVYAKMHILMVLAIIIILFFGMVHTNFLEVPAVFALALILVGYPLIHMYILPNIEPNSPLAQAIENMETELGLTAGWLSPRQAIEDIAGFTRREIAVATGDVYSSSVDSGSRKALGVFIKDIQSAEKTAQFTAGQPFNFYTKIEGQSLDFDVDLELGCEISDADNTVKSTGQISPKKASFVSRATGEGDFFDTVDVDCIIPKEATNSLTGLNTIKIFGDFNFVTRAYTNVFFIDRLRWRELSRRDLLSQITQSLPSTTSITTAGPVKVGMGAGREKQIIDIDRTDRDGPTIGLTVENSGSGVVSKVEKIIVLLPKGLSIKDVNGIADANIFSQETCTTLDESEQTSCDDQIDAVYSINPDAVLPVAEGETTRSISTFFTFRIHTEVKDYASLLGVGASLVPKRIKATVKYDYKVVQKRDIMIKQSTGAQP